MGSKKKKAAVVTKTTKDIPSWLEDGSKQAVALGQKIGSQEYTPYKDQRVATLSGNEARASSLAADGNAKARGYLDSAASIVTGQNDQAQIDKYMNPYLENVLNPTLRKTGEAFDTRRTALKSNAGKVGAFGGDRQSLLETQLDKNYLQTVGDQTGQIKMMGFQDAQERMDRSAQRLRELGGDTARMNQDEIKDLMITGGTERVLNQANLDFNYQQFTENRDWNIRNLGPLLASLQVPHGTSESTRTAEEEQKSGKWGAILGIVGTVVGAYFGQPALGAKIGSSVGEAVDG